MSFEKIISKHSNKEIFFIKPGGNFGDQLIYMGAEKIAKKYNVNFKSLNYDDFMKTSIPENSIIYIHGGGGYNSWCSGKPFKILTKLVKIKNAIVIQGSETVGLEEPFLHSALAEALAEVNASSVTIIAREKKSYDFLQGILPDNINLTIDKDTALYLKKEDIYSEYGNPQKKYNLRVIRKDPEASFNNPYHFYSSAIVDPAQDCQSFKHWINLHLSAKSIITNRTHSAILGAIIQTPTTIAGGSYHKNRSIWEYSLKDIGIDWISNDKFKAILKNENYLLMNKMPAKLKNSYKTNFLWNNYYLKLPQE